MNKLSYGLLSLIAVTPCTGYDLTQRIQLFWNANHSQIYPLLAQLEEKGYTRFEHVPQNDKPDKKIYTITEEGKEVVRQWIAEPTDEPVVRDEFALKVFSLWLVDRPAVMSLLEEKVAILEKKIAGLVKHQEELRKAKRPDRDIYDMDSPIFGPYILIEKSIATKETEVAWCRRIMRMIGHLSPDSPDA